METVQAYPVTPRMRTSHTKVLTSPHPRMPSPHETRAVGPPSPSLHRRPHQHQHRQLQIKSPSTYVEEASISDSDDSLAGPRTRTTSANHTQGNGHQRKFSTDEDRILGSPTSLWSPSSTYASNGLKRTVGGSLKSIPSTPHMSTPNGFRDSQRSRAESLSSNSSRAGQLAATLKTRLGYAMTKVQNGWEHKTIAEVEQLAANKFDPSRHSMSHLDTRARPTSSGLSLGTSQLSVYDRQLDESYASDFSPPPAKRRSGTLATFLTPRPSFEPEHVPTPRLQPGIEFNSTGGIDRATHVSSLPLTDARSSQGTGDSQESQSSQGSQPANVSAAMSPPRTPLPRTPRRPHNLRTKTQTAEAEREALQALFQLGSPHTSQFRATPLDER